MINVRIGEGVMRYPSTLSPECGKSFKTPTNDLMVGVRPTPPPESPITSGYSLRDINLGFLLLLG